MYQIVPIFAEEIESSKKANVSRDSSESFNEEMIGLNLLKKGFHLSCFPMNFANFFRQAILQHTSERPHLEDSLALSETAEPK